VSTTQSDLRDVVIYHYETKKIASIVGTNLPQTGHYNVERRIETALSRCNENYGAIDVPPGRYKVGDVLAD
jgi:hypothetical protein